MVKIYQVGGSVRDSLMGLKSKDIDYCVEASSYQEMRNYILDNGGTIFLEREEFLTIRCKMPKLGDADFVLCRKDGQYFDGRHPASVEPGTIYDDLARRDFTMNAIAIDEDGKLIDPYGGVTNIQTGVIRCVGNPRDRFKEDALRLLRAIRFSITKHMTIDYNITECLYDHTVIAKLEATSTDRIRDELMKCFKTDTLETLRILSRFSMLRSYIFSTRTNLWLKPTTEE